jgi:ATP-binding cassette subfamily B protein/ATP-binding cassette subfamily C protein
MPRRRTKKDNDLTFSQQLKAIFGVAKLSFAAAPGAVVFKLAGSLLTSIMPFVTTYFAALTTTALADAYSGVAAAGDRAILYVAITAGLGLFMTIWRSVDQYIQAKMRYIVEAKVTDRMYDQFLNLSFAQYDDKVTADLYDKSQRFTSFFAYVFDRIASLLAEFITMIAGVVALATVHIWLALIVLIAIVPGVFIQFSLTRAQIKHWNKNVDIRRTQGRIEWGLLQPQSIAQLRLYGIVKHLMRLREQLRERDEKARLDFERKYIGLRLLADTLEAITELGALIWVVLQIVQKMMPIGQFVFVQQVVSRAMGGANSFVSQLSGLDEDVANLVDYQKFMQLPRDEHGSAQILQVPQNIVFEHVWFAYGSHPDEFVLKDISLVIHKNQHIAIVGENGAGKTSFIKLLTGLYNPIKGVVKLDDISLKDIDTGSWHAQLGVLQQDAPGYSFATVRDNVRFGDIDKPDNKKNIDAALRDSEAYDFVHKLPKGIDSYVDVWMEDEEGNKGTDLSGGQWQRLSLARNFFRDAPIVILDEPTSAIDALAESRIFSRLFARKDRTIITISHRLTTVKKAEIIYMFEQGKIIEQGTHDQLVKQKGAYYKMFESQLHETEK